MTWKPKDYSSVSPYLLVRDAPRTLRFLEDVFAAKPLRLHLGENGSDVRHAEVRLYDTVIIMGEVSEAVDAHVHVYVPDVETTFAKAIAAGGKVIQDLSRAGDGDYRGGIADGNGVVWWISTQEEYRKSSHDMG